MRRPILRFFALALVATTLANCGKDSSNSDTSLRKIRVATSSMSPETLAGPYGVKAGIFKRHNLDVDWQPVANSAVAIAGLVSGDIQIAQIASPSGQSAIIQGAKIEVVATAIHRGLFALVANPGITSVNDLVGKVVASSGPGAPLDAFVAQILRSSGLQPSDVEIRTIGSATERLAAMVAGQADATLVSVATLPAALQTTGGSVLFDQTTSDEPWPFMVLTVSTDFATKNEKLLTDFLRAYSESIAQFKTDSAGAQAVITAETKQTNPEKVAQSYQAIVDFLDETPIPDAAEAQAVLDMLSVSEPKAKDFAVERLFTTKYIESALKPGG